jgi:hypothetical protein
MTRKSAVDWLNTSIGHDWVQGVPDAALAAEKKLGHEPLRSEAQYKDHTGKELSQDENT